MSLKIKKGAYTTTIDSTTLSANQTITFPDTSGTVMVSSGTGGNLIDMFYPVGTIYMSADASFDPNTKWGGTWVKIENRFLLASGTKAVGATGGEENVTLTYDQMPPHTHGVGSITGYGALGNGASDIWGIFYEGSGVFNLVGENKGYPSESKYLNDRRYRAEFNFANNRWGDTANAGSGWAHNNMPPYQVVTVWRRTA